MSTSARLPLAQAEALALEVRDLLAPATDRSAIGGSIRRRKPDVGDIELICIPRVDMVETAADLFGGTKQEPWNRLDLLCENLLTTGTFRYRVDKTGRKSWGEQLKWGYFKDFALDIYTADLSTWAVTLLIRTGPAYFSHRLATPKSRYAQRRNADGSLNHDLPWLPGLCPDHLQLKGWRFVHRKDGESLDTPTEESVLEALGYEWLPPEERTDEATLKELVRV